MCRRRFRDGTVSKHDLLESPQIDDRHRDKDIRRHACGRAPTRGTILYPRYAATSRVGLSSLHPSLDSAFCRIVAWLVTCRRRLVVWSVFAHFAADRERRLRGDTAA